MSANKGTAAQQPQLLKTLEALLKLPENRDCVDCGTKAPRWASTNLGVFMCIRCSGIHRSLGVHISKVKSVSLDKWAPEQVEFMQSMGNAKGNQIYEAYVPASYHKGNIQTENMALEQWIRDKYERKRFMARDGAEPANHREYKDQRGRDSYGRGDYREPQRDSYRDRDGDTRRDTYRDSQRDSYRDRDSQRDTYREPQRDTYRESQRDNHREPQRESYREPQRDTYRESQPKRESKPTQLPGPIRAPSSAGKTPAPITAPAPVQAPATDAFNLLDFDEPAPAPVPQVTPSQPQEDFFGDFTSASGQENQGFAPPQKDKNAILQLFHTPVMPTYGPAMTPMHNQPQMHYPGPNYNIHLQQGGYPQQYGYPQNYAARPPYGGPMPGMPGMQGGYPPQGYMQTPMGQPPMGQPPMGPNMFIPPQGGYMPQQPSPLHGSTGYSSQPHAGTQQQQSRQQQQPQTISFGPNSLANSLADNINNLNLRM